MYGFLGNDYVIVSNLDKLSNKYLIAKSKEILELWKASELLPSLTIIWNQRLRTSAGRARLLEQVVELNPNLLTANPENVLEVLTHELAHLVVFARHGRTLPHGKEWKALMREAGQAPMTYHRMDVNGLKRSRSRPKSNFKRILKLLIK